MEGFIDKNRDSLFQDFKRLLYNSVDPTLRAMWPDRDAVSALLEQHGLQGDVAFGHSKLFIRSPRTLVTLEQSRARLIPIIVLLLQKVRGEGAKWTPVTVGTGVHTDRAEYASPVPLLMAFLIS